LPVCLCLSVCLSLLSSVRPLTCILSSKPSFKLT
jgi:hypothetical protein